ncbi:asparagine synthase (glutamine-hydrolyzing) [Candidatus Dojkabacteria bacterium]|nr:asparagine synthase (glutamine-hydrolyzing) [Candidatus Dojkabacteria bacterium]
MCGITGYIDFSSSTPPETLISMVNALHHRGPDDKGHEIFHNRQGTTIGLGQTRLSILDLTSAGHQPMSYKDLCTVFNGEIYNFKEIRKELEGFGHRFISNSDTEVILHAYEQWGPEFVHRLVGMFVIVIYDKALDKLLIYRDRAGVKPIFYYWHDGLFMFASELKSLFIHSRFQSEIDRNALLLYFDFGYIPSPYSIFQHTFKVEPGKFLVLDIKKKELFLERYWTIDDFYSKAKYSFDYHEAKERVKDLLIKSCDYRMVADVPVGIFLSGGYDSSTVTALLQKDKTEQLKTFTIGFEEGNNEAPYAKKIAQYLGTDHSEYTFTTREAQDIIPELSYYYDEPFADSSAIPTKLVSKLARNRVKVALSADGGDELFAGYTDYSKLDKQLEFLNKIPVQLNFVLRPSLLFISGLLSNSHSEIKHKLRSVAITLNSNKIKRAIELRRVSYSLPHYYHKNLFSSVLNRYKTKYDDELSNIGSVLEIALAIDYDMYLQNDIMTKVDRASMSVSLEGREPLLDHRLFEFVAQLPNEYKYNRLETKRILKDISHEYIPKELLERPKAGFSLPIYNWLRGDLQYLIDEYLDEKSISESNLFNTDFVREQVILFNKDRFHYKPIIWKLLMFQMWYRRWIK